MVTIVGCLANIAQKIIDSIHRFFVPVAQETNGNNCWLSCQCCSGKAL